MKSIREKDGGFRSNRLSQEQMGAEFSARVYDLEPPVNRNETETVQAKEEIAEEMKREDCESDTMGIPIKTKRSNATLHAAA